MLEFSKKVILIYLQSRPTRRPSIVEINESAFELDDEGWQVREGGGSTVVFHSG